MAKHASNNKKKDNNNNNKSKKKGLQKKDKNGRTKRPHSGGAIVFDPDARSAYLQGFSERKRHRRVFGLAMQKVKDRKARLGERAEIRAAMREQVEEAEKQKEEFMAAFAAAEGEDGQTRQRGSVVETAAATVQAADEEQVNRVEAYQDVQTQSQWGGQVIVTTSTHIPGDSSDDNEKDDDKEDKKLAPKRKDVEQEYAGNVEKFMLKLKGNLPGKKKGKLVRKGNHGAAGMKGFAGSGDFKTAQKFLKKSSAQQTKGGGKGGRKSKKR